MLDILDRTFGIEFEFADVEKDKVVLPDGFSWNKEEVVINTDASNGSFSSKNGGEVNTPPLKLNHKNIEDLKCTFNNLINSGGRITWTKSVHVHIYVGDFDLDMLKRVFALTYYTSRYMKMYCDVGEWNEEKWQCPSPTLEYFDNAMSATNLELFYNVFANSMNKGYIRHLVNVPSFFRRKTIEFRLFNPTYDFSEVFAGIMFAYRFINYCVNHDIEEYSSISSLEDFVSKLKLNLPMAKKTPPLIFSGYQKHPHECFVSKNVGIGSKMINILLSHTGNKLSIVNPDLYESELSLYDKVDLTIYNNDEFNDIIYRICTEGLVFHYDNDYEYIERYNDGSPIMMLVCLFLFHRLRKFSVDTEYARKELEAYKDKIGESVDKLKKTAKRLIDMFSNCKYVLGTVNDAISDGGNVFFQIGNNPRMRSTASSLKKHADYLSHFEHKKVFYYDLVQNIPNDVNFMMTSKNEYLNMYKIAKSNKTIFYSTHPEGSCKLVNNIKPFDSISILVPSDNLIIDDSSKLKLIECLPTEFYQVQEVFVKKVHKITLPRFAFLVFYDGFCIGGFGFMIYPRDEDYDLWLLSDFNTNNAIKRVSKLILLCIQSNEVKRTIQRKMRTVVDNLYTKVYSQNPVSMKYRGVFKKNKEKSKPGCLIYTSDFGVSGDMKDIIEYFKKIISR